MADVSQTTFSNPIREIKSAIFCFQLHWKFVPVVPIDSIGPRGPIDI